MATVNTRLDRNGYAPSILQKDTTRCWKCGARDEKLDRHEVFGGAYRNKSKQLGLWVTLCHNRCHQYGNAAVHRNGESARALKVFAETRCRIEYNLSKSQFVKEFGKSYLEDIE